MGDRFFSAISEILELHLKIRNDDDDDIAKRSVHAQWTVHKSYSRNRAGRKGVSLSLPFIPLIQK